MGKHHPLPWKLIWDVSPHIIASDGFIVVSRDAPLYEPDADLIVDAVNNYPSISELEQQLAESERLRESAQIRIRQYIQQLATVTKELDEYKAALRLACMSWNSELVFCKGCPYDTPDDCCIKNCMESQLDRAKEQTK